MSRVAARGGDSRVKVRRKWERGRVASGCQSQAAFSRGGNAAAGGFACRALGARVRSTELLLFEAPAFRGSNAAMAIATAAIRRHCFAPVQTRRGRRANGAVKSRAQAQGQAATTTAAEISIGLPPGMAGLQSCPGQAIPKLRRA